MERVERMKGPLVVSALAAVVLGLVALSLTFQRALQMETADQFNRQQLLLAQAQAAHLQDYIDGVRERVGVAARAIARLPPGGEAETALLGDAILEDTYRVKKRIEFTGRWRGGPRAGDARAPEGAGDAALLARLRGSCPGGVLVESDAKTFSAVAPVCSGDEPVGAVAVRIEIHDIAQALLGPIKYRGKSYAWIMDGLGNLLFHPEQPDMTGRNLYRADASCLGCHRGFDLEKKIVEGRGDDFGRYVAPSGEDKIVAFSTVSVGKARWIVAVSAPYSAVTMSIMRSMRVYTLIIILGFLTTSGVAAGLVIVDRKRVQAEGRARRQEVLEMMHAEKLGALERLTSGIAAEIGSPLASIFSFVDVLMAMDRDELTRETLETIRLHMNEISDILQQLSRFSERPSAERSPCKVNGLVEGALALIQYDREVRNVTFVRELATDLPEITTDKPALAQVIVEIILRAAGAMPGGGALTVRTRRSGDRILLEFEHAGEGITKEELGRLFAPLPLGGASGGRGASLWVSLGMVRRLGGDLTAESEPGRGTRFTVSLPVGAPK